MKSRRYQLTYTIEWFSWRLWEQERLDGVELFRTHKAAQARALRLRDDFRNGDGKRGTQVRYKVEVVKANI